MANNKTSVADLHKNNSNSQSKLINSFEGFAINNSSAFSRIRTSLKETGDMFLFGKPTSKLLTIILKMYHENYIRNLCFNKSDNIKGTSEYKKLKKENHVSFMCGMIEMDDGEIYMTISEAPAFKGHIEDPKFNNKEEALIDILSACNITTDFPEDIETNEEISETIASVHRENTKNISTWRRYDDKTPQPGILDKEKISNYENHLLISMPEAPSIGLVSGINYNDTLWRESIGVNIINSYTYLKKRKNEGKSFAPFKKYNSKTQRVECNNGSTCTESKLFSYVYNNLDKTWEDIRGFAVIWIGNDLPPNHVLNNYCYNESDPKLNTMVDELLEINNFSNLGYTPEKIKEIMKLAVRPIAMACPGCYSNNLAYRSKDEMNNTLWDQRGCYTNLNARTRRRTRTALKRLTRARSATGGYSTRKRN